MTKTLSAYEARTKLGEVMNEVYYNGIEVIVERMGKPMIRIVSVRPKRETKRKKSYMEFAGVWKGKQGDLIEKYAKKLRKEAKLIRDDIQI